MSDNKLSRRNFFKLLGGGVATVIAAPYLIKEAVTRIPIELGWTWYIDKSKVDPTLAEIVSKTLRNNKDKIIDNMFENNALYAKLHDGQKVLLEIKHISPEDQTQRMKVRMQQRIEDRQKKLIDHKPHNGGRLYPIDNTNESTIKTFYSGYDNVEKKYVS